MASITEYISRAAHTGEKAVVAEIIVGSAVSETRAHQLRNAIEVAAESFDDDTACEYPELYPAWSPEGNYITGERVQHNDTLYKCLQDHTAQADWVPDTAPSPWTKVLIPDPDVIPAWEQPDSTNPYSVGDKVTHNGKTWVSGIDNNVWEPGVYGWTENEE